MGLIDFVKEAGAKIFRKETTSRADAEANREKAEALRQLVTGLGFEVSGFGISVTNGKATVSGTVPSQAIREKVVLAVGNTEGVAQVDDRLIVVKPEPEAVFYTVVKGDTLSGIAKRHYGKANAYMAIFEANRPMLADPDRIYPGQVLRIPQTP